MRKPDEPRPTVENRWWVDTDKAKDASKVAAKGERQLDYDGVDVVAGLRVVAAVDEAILAIDLLEARGRLVPLRRHGLLHALSMVGMLRVEVEIGVAFELEQRLRNRQLTHVSVRVRHVVELRCIADGPEEPG